MKSVEELKLRLAQARSKIRHLVVIGLRDNLSPEQKKHVQQYERSARAETKLRRQALDHAQSNQARQINSSETPKQD